MYAPSYGGFGQMNNSQPFNPNGGLQQPQNPHQHHQQQHQQQQQPGQSQPQQHMMYNPLAFSAGPQQAPYGTSGPVMGGNAGGMGMMQNNGLAHVPGGPMSQYQTPYTSSPYGASIPTSTSNLPQNFMPATSNAQSFAMNASNMNPQQNRMQPPPTSSTPTQRASPYGGMQQGTPPNAGNAQSQFSTPGPNQTNIQTSNLGQGGSMGTPQTPNFPPGSAGGAGQVLATPLSPGSEAREKERVSVLLLINSELLMESLRLQTVQAAEKDKEVAAGATDEASQKERAEKGKVLGREYVECMRRLQGNLAYLAAIADRHHKPSSQIPSHPQLISAPPLTPRSNSSSSPKAGNASPSEAIKSDDMKEEKKEGGSIGDLDDVDRPERLKELYKRLQGLFPGVDPKKEQSMQQVNQAAMRARQQQQAQSQAREQAQAKAQAMAQAGGPGGM